MRALLPFIGLEEECEEEEDEEEDEGYEEDEEDEEGYEEDEEEEEEDEAVEDWDWSCVAEGDRLRPLALEFGLPTYVNA